MSDENGDGNIAGTGLSAERLRDLGLDHLIPREPDALDLQELERQEKLAEKHGLTVDQVGAAERLGMGVERYAAMKDVRTADDYSRARADLARNAEAVAEAKRQLAVERAKKELEQ